MTSGHRPLIQLLFIVKFLIALIFIAFLFHQNSRDRWTKHSRPLGIIAESEDNITTSEDNKGSNYTDIFEITHPRTSSENESYNHNETSNLTTPSTKHNYTFPKGEWLKSKTPPFTVNTQFLIQPFPCPRKKRLDHLLVVKSATDNFDRRHRLRNATWQVNLSGQRFQRLVFLLGTTTNSNVSLEIQKEALLYGDIVQGPFHDSYHNLTYKSVMGLKWISEHCSNVSYVIKSDDDLLFRMPNLMNAVYSRFKNTSRTFGCYPSYIGKLISRRKDDQWRVDDDEFHGLDRFPFDYCPGFFVVITPDLIQPMMDAARVVPFFWIDDIYLYGLLPLAIGDVNIQAVNVCIIFFRYR